VVVRRDDFSKGPLTFPSEGSSLGVPNRRRNANMKRLGFLVLLVLCFSIATIASDEDANTFRAKLRGLGEAPPVATQASGSFTATLSSDGTTLSYTVTYANLNAQVLFSHIHFGFTKEVGGVMVFLCGPAAGAPGGPPAGFPNPPACPDSTSGTVSGTVTAANVVGPNSQGITPGADFAKVVQAMREGAAYVMSTALAPQAARSAGQ
jgi:hypothetical protein